MHVFLGRLKEKGLTLPEEAQDRFEWDFVEEYYSTLVRFAERGLFSNSDRPHILERHLFECLIGVHYVSSRLQVSRETRIADVGSGQGLPGVLFAALKSEPYVVLVDSSRRRLKLIQENLSRKNIRYAFARAEELNEKFDITCARALAQFPYSLELLSYVQKRNGYTALWVANLEIEMFKEEISRLGYVSRETLCPLETEFLGTRRIILLQKISDPARGYPRTWKQMKEEMDRWEK
ncbi:MAG TPA: class I SAM-dependent methyltransferase [Leptospiraceae bacterium]|nr:class I SAM-dependent methyltransferase [Leptospiraceae bacterium]